MIAAGADGASIEWIEAALVIFFVVFVLITLGVILRKRGHFDSAARIPLSDDVSPPEDVHDRQDDEK